MASSTKAANPVAGLLYRWGTLSSLAREMGVDQHAISKWGLRGRIPPLYWAAFIKVAQRKGFGDITLDLLIDLHADLGRRLRPAPLLDRVNV